MARKKDNSEPHEEHADETWLIPYSDLLTLLLALFIVLFATSSLDKNKMAQMEYAFAAAFGSIPSEGLNGTIMSFLADAKGLYLGDAVGIGADAKGATMTITDLTLFDQGSAQIKSSALPLLKQIATLLSADKYKRFQIVVEGHTDNNPINNSQFPSNWELSSARAAAVVRTLIADGLNENRFQALGMAGISPAYPNLNHYGEAIPENQLRNRRVVIRVEI